MKRNLTILKVTQHFSLHVLTHVHNSISVFKLVIDKPPSLFNLYLFIFIVLI